MEKRSVYDYIKENTDINGIIDPDTSLLEYTKDLQKDWDVYAENNLYVSKSSFDVSFTFGDEINKVEFRLYNLFEKCIKDINFSELEDYLDTTTFSVRDNVEELENRIDRNLEKLDKKKLFKLCKNNIVKTQNIYMVYIYLLVLSKLDISEDKDIQEIIMRLAITHEFTGFINEYLLDKCSYPDYKRFYIVKRIKEASDVGNILSKMKIDSQEIREWVLFKSSNSSRIEYVVSFFDKLELDKILKNHWKDRKYFIAITHLISAFIFECEHSEEYAGFTKVVKEYIKRLSYYTNDLEIYCQASSIYIDITSSISTLEEDNIFIKSERDEILDKFREVLIDKNAIELIKNNIKTESYSVSHELCNIISKLNIKELVLMLYNYYKQDPIDNYTLLYALRSFPEVHEKAVSLLFEKINWDDIIGEYENVIRRSDIFSFVEYLINSTRDYKDLAMKIYSKTLRAKSLIYRKSTMSELKVWYYNEDKSLEGYDSELIDSLEYLRKNELNAELKKQAEGLLKNNLSSIIEGELEEENIFNLVGKNDEEIIEENNSEVDFSNKELYLNTSKIFGKLSIEECDRGLNVLLAKKLIYFSEMEDGFFAFVQGNKFGIEYMVKLKRDKNYKLTEAICNCGNNTKTVFCKHVCALLIKLNKINEERGKNEEKKDK